MLEIVEMKTEIFQSTKNICAKCRKEILGGEGRYNTDAGVLCVECYDINSVIRNNKRIDMYASIFRKMVFSS